jgi:CMP-N,N'-diacetyllegionaminic acid synthase
LKILCIIPARGGSKGILMKNIRNFGEKPLITHTIEIAKKCNFFDKIVVSTDNKNIQKISELYGAQVPILRPKKLSTDTSNIYDVVKHMLNFMDKHESFVPDIVIILQPTSPFRTVKMIKKSISMLKNSQGSSVISVAKVKEHPDISFSKKGLYLKPIEKDFEKFSNRQKRSLLFHPTGSIYTFWTKNIYDNKSIYGKKIIPLIVNEKEFNLDIDDPYDFFVGEMQLKYWKKYKNFF